MKFRLAAALALGLSLIGGAGQAQMMSPEGTYGWYLRGEGGWNHTSDLSTHPNTGGSGSLQEGEGWIIGGAAGYGFGMMRLELNIDHRYNDVNSSTGAAGSKSASGSVEGTSFMGNALFDLPYNWGGFQPYVGLGAGLVHMDLSASNAGGSLVNDSQEVAAVQGMVGVRYNLTPQWGVGAEYRFLNGFHPGPFRAAGGGSFNTSDYRNSSILLSVTYSFGAPARAAAATATQYTPPPAPAPAPAPAPSAGARQLFIVFFDFDKSTITEAGRKVLDAAAAAVKSNQSVRIDVTGYTDTVGTVQYNLGLSNRRADAVRDYLSRQGIGADHMNVVGKGKTDLRVQTPDGVREPQNRRVEIVIP